MGSREAIALEKGALAEAIGPQGTLILNADDPFSEGIAKRTRAKVIFAGTKKGTVCATDLRQSASGSEFTILRRRASLPCAIARAGFAHDPKCIARGRGRTGLWTFD